MRANSNRRLSSNERSLNNVVLGMNHIQEETSEEDDFDVMDIVQTRAAAGGSSWQPPSQMSEKEERYYNAGGSTSCLENDPILRKLRNEQGGHHSCSDIMPMPHDVMPMPGNTTARQRQTRDEDDDIVLMKIVQSRAQVANSELDQEQQRLARLVSDDEEEEEEDIQEQTTRQQQRSSSPKPPSVPGTSHVRTQASPAPTTTVPSRPGAYSATPVGLNRMTKVHNCSQVLSLSSCATSSGADDSDDTDNDENDENTDEENQNGANSHLQLQLQDQEDQDEDPFFKSWRRERRMRKLLLVVAAIVFVLVIVVVLAILLPVVILPSEEDDSLYQHQGSANNQDLGLVAVPNMTNATLQALEDPHTPQFRAFDWISRDPMLSSLPGWRRQQRFALACIYFAFGLAQSGWDYHPQYHTDECYWMDGRNRCSNNDQIVTELVLNPRAALGALLPKGQMPLELVMLSNLQLVDVVVESTTLQEFLAPLLAQDNNNNNTSTSTLEQLPYLHTLKLSDTNLKGSIPSSLATLSTLTTLDLQGNHLQSSIPSQLGLLSNLQTLHLASNDLTGTVPEQLGDLTNLTSVQLQDNSNLVESSLVYRLPFCSDNITDLQELNTDWCSNPTECCHWNCC